MHLSWTGKNFVWKFNNSDPSLFVKWTYSELRILYEYYSLIYVEHFFFDICRSRRLYIFLFISLVVKVESIFIYTLMRDEDVKWNDIQKRNHPLPTLSLSNACRIYRRPKCHIHSENMRQKLVRIYRWDMFK